MKHSLKVTLVLVLLFLMSQVIGLAITNQYIKTVETQGGVQVVEVVPLPYNLERPPIEGVAAVLYIVFAIVVATVIIFLLMHFKRTKLWRVWFLAAVFFTLTIAFNSFMPSIVALVLAALLAYLKLYRPGLIVQNFTELFIYSGLAAIFVPVMNLAAGFALLAVISIYDMIAVWQTKHMVKLAKFQTKSKVFSGLLIPYKVASDSKKTRAFKSKTAILGGGDMGIPLLFAGVVMKTYGFNSALVVSLFATLALLVLLVRARDGRFYPAMPFISVGCIIGYVVVYLF